MLSNNFLISYLIVVGILGLVIVLWSKKRITALEQKRQQRIKKLKRFESLQTETPIDDPAREARDTAIESVENRFSIIRKITFFTTVTIWIIALIFPFLQVVPATVISIMAASSGVIIGIAARPFIENLISGIVISISHPIRIGDTVIIDGNYGTVEDITITHTVLKKWNWRRYIIPNSRMLAKEITNCTINDSYQWTHVEFFVAYDMDLNQAKDIAIQAAMESRFFADYEDPSFWVMELKEQGYKCWIAAWADSPIDAWELGNDIRTAIILGFRACGIDSHRMHVVIQDSKTS